MENKKANIVPIREKSALADGGRIVVRFGRNEGVAYVQYDPQTDRYTCTIAERGKTDGLRYVKDIKGETNGIGWNVYLDLGNLGLRDAILLKKTDPYFEIWTMGGNSKPDEDLRARAQTNQRGQISPRQKARLSLESMFAPQPLYEEGMR